MSEPEKRQSLSWLLESVFKESNKLGITIKGSESVRLKPRAEALRDMFDKAAAPGEKALGNRGVSYIHRELLLCCTDENNGIKLGELKELLKDFTGKEPSDNPLRWDRDVLKLLGMGIGFDAKKNTYRVTKREFETWEVKLLMDLVGACGALTRDETETLIKKLGTLTSDKIFDKIWSQSGIFIKGVKKLEPPAVRENGGGEDDEYSIHDKDARINKIVYAILDGQQIDLRYYDRGGNECTEKCSPYVMKVRDDDCFLVAVLENTTGEYTAIPLGKIIGVKKLSIPRSSLDRTKRGDASTEISFAAIPFIECGGKVETVTFGFGKDGFGDIEGLFGKLTVADIGVGMDYVDKFKRDVCICDEFFGWLFNCHGRVKIVDPKDDVKKRYRDRLNEELKRLG